LHLSALPGERDPPTVRFRRHADQARVQERARMTLVSLALYAIAGVVCYLVGSISSGYVVGKIYRNVDLRTVGSGSTGATNTFRTLGRGAGLLVAVFDILKGALAVLFAQLLFSIDSDVRHIAEALAPA